jgi:hypothetical protein
MSDQTHGMSDLEARLRKAAVVPPMRMDTDGNSSGGGHVALGPADCRALLREIEGLRRMVQGLHEPGRVEPGAAAEEVWQHHPDVLVRALARAAPP